MSSKQSISCFGKKKKATAVAYIDYPPPSLYALDFNGIGLIKVNGRPLALVQPEILRFKVYEPILALGTVGYCNIDTLVRVAGGGHTPQIYVIPQVIGMALVIHHQKYVDDYSKNRLKQILVQYDRTLLVADNHRGEPRNLVEEAPAFASRSHAARNGVLGHRMTKSSVDSAPW
ncbi:ribosomal protein S9 [Thozetella sp. PMI_491]|nr:ribosomal protein S9 [Thozetella sp. PMI_491]